MVDNLESRETISQMASTSRNPKLQELNHIIGSLTYDANFRVKIAALKLVITVPVGSYSAYKGFGEQLVYQTQNFEPYTFAVGVLGALAAGWFLASGVEDLNMAAINRGQITALSTVIASDHIAEGK